MRIEKRRSNVYVARIGIAGIGDIENSMSSASTRPDNKLWLSTRWNGDVLHADFEVILMPLTLIISLEQRKRTTLAACVVRGQRS